MQRGGFRWLQKQRFGISGTARTIEKIKLKNKGHYIIHINNDVPVIWSNELII